MRIEFLRADATDRAVLRAERSPEDRALPVGELIFDVAPVSTSDDQIAVAGALLFADFVGRDIAFANPISAAVRRAIVDATGLAVTSAVLPAPEIADASESQPNRDAGPSRVTTMTVGLGHDMRAPTPGVDRTRLDLVPGERFQGALHGVKELVIASNAWYLAGSFGPSAVLSAAGVLFADDLLAKELVIATEASDARPTPAARALCAAIGITLS